MSPILPKDTLAFVTHSARQTERIGMRLAQFLEPGDVICLEGDLGAGKTCLTRGIGRGLGIQQAITSPTFVLIGEYKLPNRLYRLYHIDLYRLGSAQEAWALGLEEYLYDDGICVIEWPERAKEVLPEEHLWINLTYMDENRRSLALRAQGERYETILTELGQNAFGLVTP